VDASEAYIKHLASGGKMFIDAGRSDEHGGAGVVARGNDPAGQGARDLHDRANLEEDIFNLVAHITTSVPNYRNLSDAEEVALASAA